MAALNKAQRKWCREYEKLTGFEPLIDGYLHDTGKTFRQCAKDSVTWFYDWANDVHYHISCKEPPK